MVRTILGPGHVCQRTNVNGHMSLSKCMTCGVCLEACPNVNSKSNFIGPAPLSQVRLFNAHPTGEMNKAERLMQLWMMEDLQTVVTHKTVCKLVRKVFHLQLLLQH